MPNHTFRFYAAWPEAVFEPIRRNWRSAVVRWDGRKIGTCRMWLMVIVLDDDRAAEWFGQWLEQNGHREDLRLEGSGRRLIEVENAIVVSKRPPLWRWLLQQVRPPREEQKT